MKRILLLFSLLALITTSFANETEVPEHVRKKLKNATQNGLNTLGTRFIVGFPKNDLGNNNRNKLSLFIGSSEETNVTVRNDITNFFQNVTTNPLGITTIEIPWDLETEIEESERVVEKTLEIISNKPISVYAMNSKGFSTEGYLAIPTNLWGNKYINCSFYDYNEAREWSGGFMVMGSTEAPATVNIKLQGRGQGASETVRGRDIGQEFTVRLSAGQNVLVAGNGTTRGLFDLTGTIIESDRPIGVISFHERCMIPAQAVTNGRDNLLAMMPPVQAWGNNYTTVELDRRTGGGDYFRLVAAEENTNWEVRWYDKTTKAPLGFLDGTIENPGEFVELNSAAGTSCGGGDNSVNIELAIKGTSIFKADKPVFVMQYAYSECWDNSSGDYDPFMFPVVSVEQFTTSTIFQTPSNESGNDFINNFLNLIVEGDPDPAENARLLSTITVDGARIVDLDANFLGNRIPGSDLYWTTLDMDVGPHFLEGEAPFGGYIYGFARNETYAWPAATAYRNLGEQDTLPPIAITENECYTYFVEFTEFRDSAAVEEEPPQIDSHMELDPVVITNVNFKDPYIDPNRETEDWFQVQGGDDNVFFIFEVDDPTQDASITYRMYDRAGNFVEETIDYFADKLRIEPDPLDFGLVRISTTEEIDITIFSDKSESTTITNISLLGELSPYFSISENQPLPLVIEGNGQATITMAYSPEIEWLDAPEYDDGQYDADEFVINTECVEWTWPVIGQGGENYMVVSDWDERGQATRQNTLENSENRIEISNWNTAENRQATWPLEVTGIDLTRITDDAMANATFLPFSVQNGQTHSIDAAGVFANPIVIPADPVREDVRFEYGEFIATEDGEFVRNIPFISDAKIYDGDVADDTVSFWGQRVISADVEVIGETWSNTRVSVTVAEDNSENGGYITIRNTSTETDPQAFISLTELKFRRSVAATGENAWVSSNPNLPANDREGEFRIRRNDPLEPANRWGDNQLATLTDGLKNAGIRIYPANAPQQANGRMGEIRIPVEFTPKAQYQTNNPQYLSENFIIEASIVVNGSEDGPVDLPITLQGEAYLPIIETVNAELTEPILAGEVHDELLTVPVRNVGTNNNLRIYSLNASNNIDWENDASGEDFTFLAADSDFDPTQLTNANPFDIAPGEEFNLVFQFNPQVHDPANIEKNADFTLYSNGNVTDGVEPDFDPNKNGGFSETPTLTAYTKEFGISGLVTPFDELIACEEDGAQLTFSNTGDGDFRIDNVTDINGDDIATLYPWLQFLDGTGTPQNIVDLFNGLVIPAEGTGAAPVINVRFDPSLAGGLTPLPDLVISFSGMFLNEDGTDDAPGNGTITIEADYYNSTVELTVNTIPGTEPLSGLEIDDGNLNLGVSISNTSTDGRASYEEMDIDRIEFIMEFNAQQLFFKRDGNGFIYTLGDVVQDWTATVEELPIVEKDYFCQIVDENGNEISSSTNTNQEMLQYRVVLEAPAGDFLQGNGDLFFPHYTVLISECNNVVVSVLPESITFGTNGERDECIASTQEPGGLDIFDCIMNFRTPEVTATQYDIDAEVTSTALRINYDNGIPFKTRIDVVDLNGNIVATPVNDYLEEGNHVFEIPLEKISSGAHFVKVHSYDFQETKKVMVVK